MKVETINALEAFLSSLPGNLSSNLRLPIYASNNVADILPMSSVYSGCQYNPCKYYNAQSPAHIMALTTGMTPFYFNCHVEDVGHTFICGPTGSGKSVLLNLLASQGRKYRQAKIFHFDKDYSALALCAGDGGHHYDLLRDNHYQLAPFANLNVVDKSDITWACDLLAMMLHVQGLHIIPEHRHILLDAVKSTLAQPVGSEFRCMDALINFIQDKQIKRILSFYASTGQTGSLFSGNQLHTDTQADCFNVFEMSALMEAGDNVCLPALSILFKVIEDALDGFANIYHY